LEVVTSVSLMVAISRSETANSSALRFDALVTEEDVKGLGFTQV
jgi:hypothetical protein